MTRPTQDWRDATGETPGTFREINGKICVAVVMPIHMGNDEYETKIRWHIAGARELKRWRHLNRISIARLEWESPFREQLNERQPQP